MGTQIGAARRAGLAFAAVVSLGLIGVTTGEQPGMSGGGGQRPAGGDRIDETQPQLGTGNRGTAQRSTDPSESESPSTIRKQPMGPGMVIGDVLKIDGSTYVIRDANGNELALQTDARTHFEGVIRIGTHVVAEVDANGHVARVAR